MSEPAASLKGFDSRSAVIKEGDDIPALLRSLFDLPTGCPLLASTIVAKAEGRVGITVSTSQTAMRSRRHGTGKIPDLCRRSLMNQTMYD